LTTTTPSTVLQTFSRGQPLHAVVITYNHRWKQYTATIGGY